MRRRFRESRVRRQCLALTSETTETWEPRVSRRFRESRVRRRCLALTSETTETRDPYSGERSAPRAALSAALGALRAGCLSPIKSMVSLPSSRQIPCWIRLEPGSLMNSQIKATTAIFGCLCSSVGNAKTSKDRSFGRDQGVAL